jgi:hypothetical protein
MTMAKGMNKRKETKKPKKEVAQAKGSAPSAKAAVVTVPSTRQKD